jgi:hypothetical protein
MSKVTGRDTKPELAVRTAFFAKASGFGAIAAEYPRRRAISRQPKAIKEALQHG